MAVRRYALLALAGAALAQMEDGQMPMSSTAAAAGGSTMPADAAPSSGAAPTTDAASSLMHSLPITTNTPSSEAGMGASSAAMTTGMSASMPYEEPMTKATTPSSMPMDSSQTTMASSMTKMSTMTTMHSASMGGMPMGTGGVMPNGTTGSGGKAPPISGVGAMGASIGLVIASVLVSTAMLQ